LSAITAAVVGVILNLAIWFGLHVLFRQVRQIDLAPAVGLKLSVPEFASVDFAALLLFAVSAVLLFRLKVGIVPVLGLCGAGGLVVRMSGLM